VQKKLKKVEETDAKKLRDAEDANKQKIKEVEEISAKKLKEVEEANNTKLIQVSPRFLYNVARFIQSCKKRSIFVVCLLVVGILGLRLQHFVYHTVLLLLGLRQRNLQG